MAKKKQTNTLPAIRTETEIAEFNSIDAIKRESDLVNRAMDELMNVGEHYGKIPGCPKPSLLKAGAEKLARVFKFNPDFEIDIIDLPNDHREYRIKCNLTNLANGIFLGSGVGSCSTLESKYRYRNAARACPACGQDETIIKGKEEYGGGWLCFKKKGGCGAKFDDNDINIISQPSGKVENENPADCYNTCLKMAKKRAFVDAVLTRTAASDVFTQDIEDDKSEPLNEEQPGSDKPDFIAELKGRLNRAIDEDYIQRILDHWEKALVDGIITPEEHQEGLELIEDRSISLSANQRVKKKTSKKSKQIGLNLDKDAQ